jgi:acetate kinase
MGRQEDPDLALILCHLGGGCSLCATIGGRSLDTTMGFTPLEGLVMGTRSGSVDAGIVIRMIRLGLSADDIEGILNRRSGMLGLSGISGDTRVLHDAIERGDNTARFALEVFVHHLRKGIGSMIATLGRPPAAIVFTDAISEELPEIRARACAAFSYLGMEIDPVANIPNPGDSVISLPESSVKVLVIRSREGWEIARQGYELLTGGRNG